MGDPEYENEKEREREVNDGPDPISSSAVPKTDQDVISEKEVAIGAMEQDSDLDDEQISHDQELQLEEANRVKSHATEVSVASVATSAAATPAQPKTFVQKLNPLNWTTPPAVPAVRTECPEAKANFFSKLIFHWQGTLMRVSSLLPPIAADGGAFPTAWLTSDRPATPASSK